MGIMYVILDDSSAKEMLLNFRCSAGCASLPALGSGEASLISINEGYGKLAVSRGCVASLLLCCRSAPWVAGVCFRSMDTYHHSTIYV